MNKDIHCPYSILDSDIICEHKSARIDQPGTTTLHNHDGYEMILFLNGDVNVFVESEEKKLERGDLVIIPPYTYHGIKVTEIDKYERIVINLRIKVMEEAGDENTDFVSFYLPTGSSKFNLIALTGKQLDELIPILSELESSLSSKKFGHSVLSRAYLTQFLVAVAGFAPHSPASDYENLMTPAVKKIFDYIDQNISSELSVDIIAKALHHNSDYLGRIFKNATGSSLKYFINGKKIALAQQMLREGNSPYNVCFELGFNNYSSFSRCFSKHIGQSPKQYVMSLR